MIASSHRSDYPISSKTGDLSYVFYNLSNVHDAAKKQKRINSEEMDEIPGRIANGNLIASYNVHEALHQQFV